MSQQRYIELFNAGENVLMTSLLELDVAIRKNDKSLLIPLVNKMKQGMLPVLGELEEIAQDLEDQNTKATALAGLQQLRQKILNTEAFAQSVQAGQQVH